VHLASGLRLASGLHLASRMRLASGLALAAACAAAALSGCGSQVAGPPAGSAGTTSVRPAGTAGAVAPAVGPRQRAAADATRIIADFRRPPGAVRTGRIASLDNPAVGMGTSDVVTATRWWRVPGQPRAVLSWISAHLPSGYTAAGSGSVTFGSSTGALVESQGDAFALSPVPGVLPQRQLVVTVMRYRGQTALRTDAQVAWLPARPVAERIPSVVRAVTVTPVSGLNPDPRGDRLDRAFTVTDPAKVARMVALANSLTIFPPGARPCPASFGGAMRLAFTDRPGGRVLARFTAQYGGCGIVSVSIGGKTEPALSTYLTAEPLVQDRMLAIAGVRWPHQPGAPAGVGN
jgi:hypothetical protein